MPNVPASLATYIDNQEDLSRLVEKLSCESLLAFDTESNSLYAYKEQVCLIQVSTRTEDYIIDPLLVDDVGLLAPLMASPTIEKVFHAAEYDVVCMKRDFGFEFRNIFDTMTAARICGFKNVGLSSMLYEFSGVMLDKSHQRDDWKLRPLSEDSLYYAQMDTYYLPYLRDELYQQLKVVERLEEAYEVFNEICNLPPSSHKEFDPEGFWNIGLPHMLKRQQMRVLREVYCWREQTAQEVDTPPFKIMHNGSMITVAQTMPISLDALHHIHGINRDFVARYGETVLQLVRQGRASGELSSPPRQKPPDAAIAGRYMALFTWRKERAQERGVDSDVIISKQTLWDLAHKSPASLDELQVVPGIGSWRLAMYGEEILQILGNL